MKRLLPENSIECHCSRHICEESEKEEESCQVGHRGDGTKDISVSTGTNLRHEIHNGK